MNKKLFRIAAIVCMSVSVVLAGQIIAFADEVKPIHEYNFDKDSGNTVIDSGSDGKNGTATGTDLITGYNGLGYARNFESAKTEFIKFGSFSIPNSARSIRLKVRRNGIPSGQSECILSTTNTNGDLSSFICINGEDTTKAGTLKIMVLENSVFNCVSPTSICDGKWHDILFTYDSSIVKLYIDDMENPVFTQSGEYSHKSEYTENRITIGSYIQGSDNGGGYFQGDIDNIQIYDSAITPDSTKSSKLTAVGGESKVALAWNAVTDATSYTIKRSTTAGGPYTTIATDVTDTTYIDADVTNGTIYYYVVTSTVNGSESKNSNEASATPSDTTGPGDTTNPGGPSDQGDTTNPGDTSDTSDTVKNELKVVLEPTEKLQLSVDDDLDENAEMSWTSSDTSVATVNGNGVVTALAPGNTKITVTSEDGTYSDYINVLVVEDADDYRLAVDLKVGQTSRLTIDDLTDTVKVKWVSMDSSIAKVSSKGKVKAVSEGLALVTALDKDGNIIGKVYVRVRE